MSHVTRHMSHVFLTAGSSLLLILSFPPFDFEFLAWIALVPLFFALDGRNPTRAFSFAYCGGILFFLGTIWWLIHVTLPGMIAAVLYLALYFGFFGLVASRFLAISCQRSAVSRTFASIVAIPSAWVTMEYLRAHLFTGFGWGLLGYSQYLTLPVIQISDFTGAWGVSFLITMVNGAVYLSLKEFRGRRGGILPLAAAGAILFIVLCYGNFRLRNIFTGESFRISVIQGNIPQNEKWEPGLRDRIMARYETLTREASRERPDLIVWPETSVPGFLEERELSGRVSDLARGIGIPLLVGVVREEDKSFYNSAVLFSGKGEILSKYDKLHLVPFGEYIPCRTIFSFIEKFAPIPIGDCTKGGAYTVFVVDAVRTHKDSLEIRRLLKKVRFSCLICFEDLFPDLVRGFMKEGATFLVNITNDAWYLKTAAPYQHAQASVFRAVELRTNVVRAANTGLSCFIDQKGRIAERVDIFVEGFKTYEILLSRVRTFYLRFGDVFAYIAMAITMVSLLGVRVTRGAG